MHRSRCEKSLGENTTNVNENQPTSYWEYPFVGRPRRGQWHTMPLHNHVRVGFRSSDLR